MQLAERIALLARLGDYLRSKDERLDAVIQRTSFSNLWFTKENQWKAVEAIAHQWLTTAKLQQWIGRYAIPAETTAKKIGLVLAGNIPMVGFHDVVSVFATGHSAVIKPSEKDPYLLPFLVRIMAEMDERIKPYFHFVEKLEGFDAVIATGSNNSSRYFEAYFGKYPNIIRRNRNGIAVLTGQETPEELAALGKDVFRYFGLGCRNVSKFYVPEGYDFGPLLEALHEHRQLALHDKYKNNFDYNTAIAILNKTPYLSNGCLVLMENESIVSPIAAAYYQYYANLAEVEKEIVERAEEIQLVIARPGVLKSPTLPFGTAQEPELWDYADGVDTVAFLLKL